MSSYGEYLYSKMSCAGEWRELWARWGGVTGVQSVVECFQHSKTTWLLLLEACSETQMLHILEKKKKIEMYLNKVHF